MGASRESVTSNNASECILDALKPAVFLCGAKKQRIGVG